MIDAKTRQFEKFIYLLCQLQPVEICGVARILNVSFGTKEQHREFHEVYEDILDKFLTLNRRQRKNLLKIVAEAVKQNGSEPEYTDEKS